MRWRHQFPEKCVKTLGGQLNSKNGKARSNLTSSMYQPGCPDRADGVDAPKIQISRGVALPSLPCSGRSSSMVKVSFCRSAYFGPEIWFLNAIGRVRKFSFSGATAGMVCTAEVQTSLEAQGRTGPRARTGGADGRHPAARTACRTDAGYLCC